MPARFLALSLPLLAITACGSRGGGAPAANPATVVRSEKATSPETGPKIEQPVLATQPGPNGTQVQLNKVAVAGDVMTVQLTYLGGKGSDEVMLNAVYVIDDASARKIGVLKSDDGAWLASPMSSMDDRLSISFGNYPSIVWFKFPAPPAGSKTVSVIVPHVGPFDGMAVTR
jgi:hypothetical protein